MKLTNISNNGRIITLFTRNDKGELKIDPIKDFFPYWYEPNSEGQFKGYTGELLEKKFGTEPRDVRKFRSDKSWESDIQFCKRYLIDKIDKIDKTPLKIAWLDMEIKSDEFPNPNKAKFPISCISIGNSFTRKIKTFWLPNYKTEYEMIEDFIKYMKIEQFDLMVGWNLQRFDFPYFVNRIPDFAQKISSIGQTRYASKDTFYPAGLSIIDYMLFYKIMFKNLNNYSLDNVLEHEFGTGKKYKKVDFSTLNDEVRLRNIDDVRGMIKIDEKHHIINHFNEIRLFTKTDLEDFKYNSRPIDMMLLEESKNKGVVLPKKPYKEEGEKKEKFEQAYRDCFKTGRFENAGKYDLSGAYLNTIIDLCLDTANITTNKDNAIPINVTDRKTQKVLQTYYIKQNRDALLPSVAQKLLNEKNKIKKLKNNTNPETKEYDSIEKRYEAMKALVLSLWGVIGNEHFRMFDVRIASLITSTIRDIMHYIEDELRKKGYFLLHLDTDGIIVDDKGENLTELLNNLMQEWSNKRFNRPTTIKFDYEGKFEVVILLACTHYKGWLRTPKGKLKVETKGISAKKKNSTKFIKNFQPEALVKIKEKISEKDMVKWANKAIKNFNKEELMNIAFPVKLSKPINEYGSDSIWVRALRYTQEINPNFKKKVGQPYYYIYVKSQGYEEKEERKELIMTYNKDGEERGFKNLTTKRLEKAIQNNGIESKEELMEKGIIKVETVMVKNKEKNVLAFDEDNYEFVKDKTDWQQMVRRNIILKLETIFNAMKWDISKIEGKSSSIIPKKTPKSCKRANINEENSKKDTMYPPVVKDNKQNTTQPVENKEDTERNTLHCDCGMTFDNDKDFMNHLETKCRLNKKEKKKDITPYYTE